MQGQDNQEKHTGLGNDAGDVHDLLLRRRRWHLEPPCEV